ncbi:hypothetical protein D9756_006062 [Leucocoprinus leucothites]|uniref:DRBM domain-containing protein n=1 Tax=Leucocoprinus leucothites TaxID=201217 RepID=A0A8H5D3C3_9AGAR|nr:hypothetical protein D9756_006062 [Leucoagaricus leucothites]
MQHAHPSLPLGTFSAASLKRPRSGEFPRTSTSELDIPRLPKIGADLVLEVYTHESLRPPNTTKPEDFLDNRRLAKLGEKVLDTAVTLALLKKQPFLSGEDIEGGMILVQDQMQRIVNNDVIQGWVKSYSMASRIICRAEYKSKREAPEECRRVFCAYVGAVFRQSGQDVVGKWIELLVQYHEQQGTSTPTTATSSSGAGAAGTGSDVPPAKKIKNEPTNSSLTSFAALSPTPSSVSTSTSTSNTTSSSATTQAYSPTAPYLNGSQQPYPSTYPARQMPPHMSNRPSMYQNTNNGGGTSSSSGGGSLSAPSSQMGNLNALFQSLTKLSQSPHLRAVTANQAQQAQKSHASTGYGPVTSTHRPNPLAPATPNAPFLPMFNQSAAQRGVKVDYSAEFEGPAHAGQWSVECLVNGIPKGKGKGSSKQIAKEEAARQAYYSMGWT